MSCSPSHDTIQPILQEGFIGVSFRADITWQLEDKTFPDLSSGFTAAMQFRVGIDDEDAAVGLTNGDGLELLDDGLVKITISAVTMAELQPGTLTGELMLKETATGIVTRLCQIRLMVIKSYTRLT